MQKSNTTRRVNNDQRGRIIDLTGQRFTRLVVLCSAGRHNSHGERLWICQCDCGNTAEVSTNSLRSGNAHSCGCYHKIRTRALFSFSADVIRVNRVFGNYRSSARKKSHSFELSKEEVARLMDAKCHYCGESPSNSYSVPSHTITVYQGIDRVDNSKGYTIDNVVPCCIVCNKMKKAMGRSEFLLRVKTIASRCVDVAPQDFCI